VRRFSDEFTATGEGEGFTVERTSRPDGAIDCLEIATMPAPELSLGDFHAALGGFYHGPVASVRAAIVDPEDPRRPVATGWSRYSAQFDASPTNPVYAVTMDAHQEWWVKAWVLGEDSTVFDADVA
jgi:hypothetical protein